MRSSQQQLRLIAQVAPALNSLHSPRRGCLGGCRVNGPCIYQQLYALKIVTTSIPYQHEPRLFLPAKSYLKGGRALSSIWRYGIELEYEEDSRVTTKLWLYKRCHLDRQPNNAKVVSGTRHMTDHMIKIHRIDPSTGMLPETPLRPAFSSPFEVAKVAGSGTILSHTPWQDKALQSALVAIHYPAVQ
jgi:hypothetical protein